ncbi:MBL fold metallo-hydrolase [Arthrobacter castelli]|uniref:MBL fold metallo-hydrolase n=1 Tax=Arthrobacter castelli TaxID=271431 RepID=UPI00040AE971|nr:MBL fold metallo-hydrolase [Arthrobacter castelli]
MTNPALTRSSPLTEFRLAPNPGPMSLDGTNSYVLAARTTAAAVVVDPGPLDQEHLEHLAARQVELVLITHRHADHTEAAAEFHRITGAPVRALDPAHCHGGAPLADGERIHAGGVDITVLATPGHTSDSVCFQLPDDGAAGSVLTGDTILGRGTTILDYPDGRLGPYLDSLRRLQALGQATVLPAHGPVLPDLAAVCTEYIDHRQQRLDQIRQALQTLGAEAPAGDVVDVVYHDVDASVRGAALKSVEAQLDYLRS